MKPRVIVKCEDGAEVSDGYHTFDELYEHRFELYLAFAKLLAETETETIFRCKKHHDGSSYDGWFMLGIDTVAGNQITYHLPLRLWDRADFAETHERSPYPFDGHTSDDVLKRLAKL
jgi:hypothetical protein